MKNKAYFKILLITDAFEPAQFGGAEIYFYNLIKGLKENKDISLFLIARTNSKSFMKKLCREHIYIPHSSNKYISTLLILLYLPLLNLLLTFKRFKIVLLNHPITYFFTLFIPDRKKRIIFHSPWCFEYKYRAESQNSKLQTFSGQFIRFYIEKFVYNHTKNIITLSNYMKKICLKLFRTKSTIQVIYPSIDTTEFGLMVDKYTIRKELNIPPDKTIFFTARSMIPRTGISLLLNAINLTKDKLHDCLFIIAGGGTHLNFYKNLSIEKDIHNMVRFTGFLDRKILIKYFFASDCFLMPSQKLEGFGLVILEALYTNIPIIATPVGAIPEILRNVPSCRLSKSKSPQDFATELLNFIQSKNNITHLNLQKHFLNKFGSLKQFVDQIINP